MKKIITLVLLLCMTFALAACSVKEDSQPESTPTAKKEITLQDVYDAGKTLAALLGDHESVYIQVMSDGKVIQEEYLTKEYCYSYSSADYMDMGVEYTGFTTEKAEYILFEGICAQSIILKPDGMLDMKERFNSTYGGNWISSELLDDEAAIIEEKDGTIVVSCTADMEEIVVMGDDVVSCVETYTLDAETLEMTSVKTVYTYKDGTVEEGVANITRDVAAPEGTKKFLEYLKSTDLRTVTIVSNPGAENEKTETVQVPNGLQVGISPDWTVDKEFTLYKDAACTETFEEDWNTESDITFYVKWNA